MKIPFDIKFRPQIESGEYKVETGDKKRVRIICWNRKFNGFPVVALAYDAQRDIEIFINASVLGEPKTDIASDRLFIITPEPELSEFEHAFGLAIVDAPEPEEKEEWYPYIKEKATELLDLARKEALKDLPRWKRSGVPHLSTEVKNYSLDGEPSDLWLLHCGWKINVKSLEKLPGFNE